MVVFSAPYLQQWINCHPLNNNPNAYLWHNPQYKEETEGENNPFENKKRTVVRNPYLSYSRLASILKDTAKKAGINKRVYCHLLRHSRATDLAPKMTEANMCSYLGWSKGSRMPGRYIHMSGKETDDIILMENGLYSKESVIETSLIPIKCGRCFNMNEATNKYCRVCGLPLSNEEANKVIQADMNRKEADETMNLLLQDPEIRALMKRKLSSSPSS